MIRCLLYLSLSLLFVSCSPSIVKGCRQAEMCMVGRKQLPPMADVSGRLAGYNMTVDFMRKHFSGMLLVRENGNGTCRALFSTHFGLSLFDLEIGKDTLIVHHCIDPLRKEKILDLFRQDFSILFGLNLYSAVPSRRYLCPACESEEIYRLIFSRPKIYYRKHVASGRLTEIRAGSGMGKTLFRACPDSISIRHPWLKLKICLEEISSF